MKLENETKYNMILALIVITIMFLVMIVVKNPTAQICLIILQLLCILLQLFLLLR